MARRTPRFNTGFNSARSYVAAGGAMTKPVSSGPRGPVLQLEIFLCHNRKDQQAVTALQAALLQRYGITSWMDRKSVTGGADFEKEILNAIQDSSSCGVIVGPYGWEIIRDT